MALTLPTMVPKDDTYAVALRNLRRGLSDGNIRSGKEATGEWLAERWPPYLAKRAERTSSIALCSEINAILGEGTPPAWFKREIVTPEEQEVLEQGRDQLRHSSNTFCGMRFLGFRLGGSGGGKSGLKGSGGHMKPVGRGFYSSFRIHR